MNKFHVALFIIILTLFAGILYFTQSSNSQKGGATPSLPPDASTLHMITSSALQQKDQQVQGAQAQQQQAQQSSNVAPTFGVEEGVKASYSAVIKTSKGTISLTLDGKDAPNTVKNFITKAKGNFYNGLIFHRVEDWVIQGGDPKGNGTGGGVMRTEINAVPFTTGSLGVARGGDINVSNDSQFFITKTDAAWLNQQYTNFGQVTDGMDVVNQIQIGDKILSITIQ